MRSALFAALALTAGALAPGTVAAQSQNCKLARIDEWKVVPNLPTPVIEGRINGRRIGVLIDTGMSIREGALLERALARQLGVPLIEDPRRRLAGIGGETRAQIGVVNEFRIGEATRRDWWVLVGGEEHGQQGRFIIGNSFFRDLDLELDLPRDRVRLFKSQDCRGVSLAYWTKSPSVAPIWVDGWTTVKVLVNGKEVVAMLDSGASSTLMDTSVLPRIGGEAQLRTAPPGRCVRGFGKQAVPSQIGQFDTFVIGDELIRNPKIYFADLRKDLPRTSFFFFEVQRYDMPEMILGTDFLRAHRVLIARQQGLLFFTYEGGTVFPLVPAPPCSEQAVEPKR